MQPALELEENETHRKQKSFTTWQTGTQLPLTGKSMMFACEPQILRLFTETSHWELQWGRACELLTS